jgi:hypothetical protein
MTLLAPLGILSGASAGKKAKAVDQISTDATKEEEQQAMLLVKFKKIVDKIKAFMSEAPKMVGLKFGE